MSGVRSPGTRLFSWVEAVRILGRAVAVQVRSVMVPWRWLLLTLGFTVSAWAVREQLESSFHSFSIRRPIDAWDLFPGLLTEFHLEFLVFGFGFLLFVADMFERGREEGTMTTALVRMPSRALYWLGTMGAVGVTALGFAGLAFVITLLAGMVIAPPSSLWPMLPREDALLMYPSWSLPVPVYSLIAVGYTAWALWVTGSAIVFLSLFVRRKAVVLGVIVLWNAVSVATGDTLQDGLDRLLNVGFLVGIFKHHLKGTPVPMTHFFAVTGAALVLMALAGSWKMRREQP